MEENSLNVLTSVQRSRAERGHSTNGRGYGYFGQKIVAAANTGETSLLTFAKSPWFLDSSVTKSLMSKLMAKGLMTLPKRSTKSPLRLDQQVVSLCYIQPVETMVPQLRLQRISASSATEYLFQMATSYFRNTSSLHIGSTTLSRPYQYIQHDSKVAIFAENSKLYKIISKPSDKIPLQQDLTQLSQMESHLGNEPQHTKVQDPKHLQEKIAVKQRISPRDRALLTTASEKKKTWA